MNLAHIGFTVSDLDKSVLWYKKILNFEEIKRFEKKEFEIKGALISNGEINIELLMPYKIKNIQNFPENIIDALKLQGLNHIALNVENIKSVFEILKTDEIKLLTDIIDDRYFFCFDPDGILMEIKQQ